jgi:two-component system, NtrC family, sensor kinase
MRAILVLLLVMAAGYPVLKLQFDDYGYYERMLEQLNELQMLDAETNSLMMRSRLDIDKNYDRLSALPAKIEDIQAEITAEKEHLINTNNSALVSNFEGYLAAEKNKSAIVENFKSHNSVLRNSVRYAPIAADRLIQAAMENRLAPEAEVLKKLKADILEYSLTGRITIKRIIAERSSGIMGLQEKLPAESSLLAISFFNHLNVITQEKEITDAYLQKAINAKTGRFLSSTATLLQSKIETNRSSFSNKILLIYLGAFLLILLYQITVSIRSGRRAEPLDLSPSTSG